MFERIDEFYEAYHSVLLEGYSGSLRPVKSFTKDISTCIEKFLVFLQNNPKDNLSSEDLQLMFGLGETNTLTQNIRNLKEFNLIVEVSNGDETLYEITPTAKAILDSDMPFNSFILENLFNIRSIDDFSIYYNFLICTLREGYKYGSIIKFPDSSAKYVEQVPDAQTRENYQKRVLDIYGFESRNSENTDEDFAPNISYMSINQLTKLKLIEEQKTVTAEGLKTFCITPVGYYLLDTLNKNLLLPGEIPSNVEDMKVPSTDDEQRIVKGGFNKIYYGAPGCGKSRFIKDLLQSKNVPNERIFRLTFHPEYANSDFEGQILPSVEEKKDEKTGEENRVVEYKFSPGPFALALLKAYRSSSMVYLIIEEINRGNAASIFGDLFQLLDRERDDKSINWSASEFHVRNTNLERYLQTELKEYNPHRISLVDGIYIPSNLTIFATMNSSDQNVFTLDTAFKRRWTFEQISNDIAKDDNHPYKNWYIPGTSVTWETFLVRINKEILDKKITNEDKRLGKYFVTKDCLTKEANCIDEEKSKDFAYKVLEYIWNDVCRMGKDEWFDTSEHKTLESLIDSFVHPSEGESPLAVFKDILF